MYLQIIINRFYNYFKVYSKKDTTKVTIYGFTVVNGINLGYKKPHH